MVPLCLLLALLVSVQARFIVPAGKPVVVARMDPIVQPGAVSQHVHNVYGASNFREVPNTPAEQQNAQCSTVRAQIDKSNYWTPALYFMTPNGYVPLPSRGRWYYHVDGANVQPFPAGMRMVTGTAMSRAPSLYNMATARADKGWECDGIETGSWLPNGTSHPNGCKTVVAKIMFPSCGWANQSLDSTGHQAHMTWPIGSGGGKVWQLSTLSQWCPPSHPIKYPGILFEQQFNIPDDLRQYWTAGQPHVILSNGDTAGHSYHADFISGWKEDQLREAMKCMVEDRLDSCAPFVGSTDNVEMETCRLQGMIPDEDVGYFKPLKDLPGCNKRWDWGMGDSKPACSGGANPGWTKPNVAVYDRLYNYGMPAAVPLPLNISNTEVPILNAGFKPAVGNSPYYQGWCENGNEWQEKIRNPNPGNCGTNQDISLNLNMATAVWKTNTVQAMNDRTPFLTNKPVGPVVPKTAWQALLALPKLTCWWWPRESIWGPCTHPAPDTMGYPGYIDPTTPQAAAMMGPMSNGTAGNGTATVSGPAIGDGVVPTEATAVPLKTTQVIAPSSATVAKTSVASSVAAAAGSSAAKTSAPVSSAAKTSAPASSAAKSSSSAQSSSTAAPKRRRSRL